MYKIIVTITLLLTITNLASAEWIDGHFDREGRYIPRHFQSGSNETNSLVNNKQPPPDNDNRQGFILNLGAGLHSTDVNISNGDQLSAFGLATSFKVGGGFTDQFLLYYVRNASWATIENTTVTLGISGLGASYFLAPSAPSGYFMVAVGQGDLSAPFESNVKSDTGSAFMFGGGYEFSKHVMAEATLLKTNIKSADISSLSVESSSFQFTINYLFY